jgi:Bacterial regulatory helix-turn-helix protein, lysR family
MKSIRVGSIRFVNASQPMDCMRMNEINLAHLDLNLLVTFEVLMTEGSVTRAADRLARTQSAISHSLARLREQLGDPLLIKVGSAMVPSLLTSIQN